MRDFYQKELTDHILLQIILPSFSKLLQTNRSFKIIDLSNMTRPSIILTPLLQALVNNENLSQLTQLNLSHNLITDTDTTLLLALKEKNENLVTDLSDCDMVAADYEKLKAANSADRTRIQMQNKKIVIVPHHILGLVHCGSMPIVMMYIPQQHYSKRLQHCRNKYLHYR